MNLSHFRIPLGLALVLGVALTIVGPLTASEPLRSPSPPETGADQSKPDGEDSAGESEARRRDVPDPLKILKAVRKRVQQHTKKNGFALKLELEGGTSYSRNHSVDDPSTIHHYAGKVYRGTMRLETPDAYLREETGAMRTKGEMDWRRTRATRHGSVVQNFVDFPHVLLQNALKPDAIEWVWVGDENEGPLDQENPVEEEDGDGHTTVVKRKEKAKWEGLPHLIRVELPKKVATQHFDNIVINSRLYDTAA